ncbi:MAG: glycosyltransferase family 2 protein, partial [Lachnospiraceae bacterium]|nr:glycosyltransferase family 2 protein [Lachnospiraceae bacterium]
MTRNPFYKIIEGYEDMDLRQQLPSGLEYGQKPLVSIWVSTYNHERYIRQCLDSIVVQKKNFPIEIIIADDCSTDGNQGIIREYAEKYPEIIRPILGNKNTFSEGRSRFIEQFVPLARGKYFACCEGDDYWIYAGKLQRMADFLESRPEYSMIFHAFKGKSEVKGLSANFARLPRCRKVGIFEVIVEPHIHYAAFMGRIDNIREDNEFQRQYRCNETVTFDMRTYLSLYNSGKVYGLPDFWSVYRLQPAGVYTELKILHKEKAHDDKILEELQTFYDGKYKKLVAYRTAFLDLQQQLDSWTYARRERKYLKALKYFIVALMSH